MSRIIAELYEIEKKIGSGGGGIVYSGRHLRLNKQIVLKADKRTLKTGTEKLRREVDLLKNLSHTYIPQVYDFVQENGTVYTVMDFIEGESLDKLLKRGELPEQPQVICWACQLLEALKYLHSCPPYGILHSDIKPSNIMLRPNGNICLIDFNIALALGEDGAVKAGFSRGYASPEHYGTGCINGKEATTLVGERTTEEIGETITDRSGLMQSPDDSHSSGKSSTSGQRKVMLDVRSDIYSLGATLYHLLSGRRPEQDAREVIPLGEDICSPAVSEIIRKAMEPDPGMRYQTAEEMLSAFLQLHKRDKRVIRHKRRIMASAIIFTLLFLMGGGCTFVGLKQMEQLQRALTLSEYSANALSEGKVSEAIGLALRAIPKSKNVLEAPVTAQAQKALTDALSVYDLKDGFKSLDNIELPSAPFRIVASSGGSRFAVAYAYEAAVFNTETQEKEVTLSLQKSALADVVFVGEDRIVYAGDQGITAYDLNENQVLWKADTATMLALSGDEGKVAAVNRDEDHVTIYDVSDGMKLTERSFEGLHMDIAVNDIFADPGDDILALNADGTMLAVSFSNGGLMILNLQDTEEDMIIYEESDYNHFEGGFCGQYFAFTAEKGGEARFGLIDTEKAVYIGGYESNESMILQADEKGIFLANENLLVSLEMNSAQELQEKELAYTNSTVITAFSVGKEYVLTATNDQSFSFYDGGANLSLTESCTENCDFVLLAEEYAIIGNRNDPGLRLLKQESHPEAQFLSYDPRNRHSEARVSQDGCTVMLFDYNEFSIYGTDGQLMMQEALPDAEYIYDQQFIRNEEDSLLEVIWYDGTVRRYSAADGHLISEEKEEPPSKDLYEEFYTEKYRIVSSLHSTPEVYALKSGKLLGTLEEEAYLTYVTQMGEYIVTEYINTEGERYGILLDDKLQKLAFLPALCDATEDTFIFDYESGDLRQCRLYTLQELIALGEEYLTENQ